MFILSSVSQIHKIFLFVLPFLIQSHFLYHLMFYVRHIQHHIIARLQKRKYINIEESKRRRNKKLSEKPQKPHTYHTIHAE